MERENGGGVELNVEPHELFNMNGGRVITLDVCHSDVTNPGCRETVGGNSHHAYMGIAAQIQSVNGVVNRLHFWHRDPGFPCLQWNILYICMSGLG